MRVKGRVVDDGPKPIINHPLSHRLSSRLDDNEVTTR
jgi:hypothetical protein